MDTIDITIDSRSLKPIFDGVDNEQRAYCLTRINPKQNELQFKVNSDDWIGPEPHITLHANGTWTSKLDVYFG